MLRPILAAASLASLSLPAHAGNVTRQQSCQLMAQHVAGILESRDWSAEAAPEIATLDAYAAVQADIITGEIADSAARMAVPVADIRAMVDTQGEQLKAAMENRYGTEKLYRDYAVSLQGCARLSPDRLGTTPETFVEMLQSIGTWAQEGK